MNEKDIRFENLRIDILRQFIIKTACVSFKYSFPLNGNSPDSITNRINYLLFYVPPLFSSSLKLLDSCFTHLPFKYEVPKEGIVFYSSLNPINTKML